MQKHSDSKGHTRGNVWVRILQQQQQQETKGNYNDEHDNDNDSEQEQRQLQWRRQLLQSYPK